jgi:cation/acetate symporter
VAGLVAGGTLSTTGVLMTMFGATPPGWPGAVLAQPALVTVPVGFAVMTAVSLVTRRPLQVSVTMVRLHTPEHLPLDRGTYHPEARREETGPSEVADRV